MILDVDPDSGGVVRGLVNSIQSLLRELLLISLTLLKGQTYLQYPQVGDGLLPK